MTIKQHISAIRALLKLETKDTLYTEALVYDQLLTARSFLLKQKLSRNKVSNFQNYQQFCLRLEQDLYHDCDCIPIGCTVLKSIEELPKFLSNNNGLIMSVKTFDGTQVSYSPAELQKSKLSSRYKADKITYDIQNNKLIIFGNNSMKAVLISGILEDPTELVDYNICDETGAITDTCFTIDTSEFPIDPDLVYPLRNLVLERISPTLSLRQDVKNDNNEGSQV